MKLCGFFLVTWLFRYAQVIYFVMFVFSFVFSDILTVYILLLKY